MSGDKFSLQVNSWWSSGLTSFTNVSPLSDLAAALATGMAGVSGGKASVTDLNTSGLPTNAATSFLGTQSPVSTKPKAFVNWVLLDEQFKIVRDANNNIVGSGSEQVGSTGVYTTHSRTNLPVAKNGYLYIYVSNESSNQDVFFDNLQVTHIRGPILEETHYYPFGLVMNGISSSKLTNNTPNKYKYNSIEQNNDFELNVYDAHFRNLDPQIGKFWQIDPKLESAESWSPYTAMLNNPIRYSDPLGDSAAWFRPDGSFWKFVDDGKKAWSGVFYQKATVSSTFEKNGVEYAVNSYSDGVSFQFNDPDVDVLAIKNGVESNGAVGITGIEMMTDEKAKKQIDRSGVNSPPAQNSPISYAKTEGPRIMDYGVQGILHGDLDPKKFYFKGGVAYNVGDIGNYLWGRGMGYLGIPLGVAQLGATGTTLLMVVTKKQSIMILDQGHTALRVSGILQAIKEP